MGSKWSNHTAGWDRRGVWRALYRISSSWRSERLRAAPSNQGVTVAWTLILRPHVTSVSTGHFRKEMMSVLCWGIRSGRERSSPTRGHGCLRVPGRRKCVGLVLGNERPPGALPPRNIRCRKRHLQPNLGQWQLELLDSLKPSVLLIRVL